MMTPTESNELDQPSSVNELEVDSSVDVDNIEGKEESSKNSTSVEGSVVSI